MSHTPAPSSLTFDTVISIGAPRADGQNEMNEQQLTWRLEGFEALESGRSEELVVKLMAPSTSLSGSITLTTCQRIGHLIAGRPMNLNETPGVGLRHLRGQ